MTAKVIIPISSGAAAEKQLDQLQNVVNAIILASTVIILADAAAEKDVSFLGLKTETSGAYGIAATAFVLATLMIGQLFARLGNMVASADSEEAPKVLATIFNHRWSLNPFSYFGVHPVAALHACFGMGLLTLVWWLGLTALAQLWGRLSLSAGPWERGLWHAYVVAGVLALAGMLHVHRCTAAKLGELRCSSGDADLEKVRRALWRMLALRCGVAVVFSGLGYWIFYQLTHIGA